MKKDNSVLIIGAAVILYLLLSKKINLRKPGSSGGSGAGLFNNLSPMQKSRIKANVEKAVNSLNFEPQPDEMDEFKKQYESDIKQCKI